MNALLRLRRFARPADGRERCALCAREVGTAHRHLVQTDAGNVVCACEGCASLFGVEPGGRYRRVSERVVSLEEFRMPERRWQALGIPVGLAFFVRASRHKRVAAFYPSPLGAAEASVEPEHWDEIVRDNPGLATLEEDVEALLLRRAPGKNAAFRVPVDECYRLVGLLRRDWRGFSGGDQVHRTLESFFEALSARTGA